MTSDHLLDAIRSQYPSTFGWIVLPQVANATGAVRGRTSDAIAMNAWPSRGLELVGFECKISRQDWRRELEQPAKADPIYRYCDGWYLVTPDDADIVRGNELPSTWGHLVACRNGAAPKVVKVASKLRPKAMDRLFLASILRRLCACETPEAKVQTARDAGRKEGIEEGRKLERARLEHSTTFERIRYQRDNLESLERVADRTLRAIRQELVALKDIPTAEPAKSSTLSVTMNLENMPATLFEMRKLMAKMIRQAADSESIPGVSNRLLKIADAFEVGQGV